MRKSNPGYKEYQKRDWRKRERYMRRVKEGKISHGKPSRKKKKRHLFSPTIPEYFSLLDNTNQTLQYFKDIHESIVKATPKDVVYFDLSSVTVASPDAFLYIIAILNNDKKLNAFKIHCSGNEPLAEEPRKLLQKAGFFQYVKSRSFHPTESEEKLLRINRGAKPDPLYAGKLCDFIHNRSSQKIDRTNTKRFYAMLIELMNNTKQHAFDISNPLHNSALNNWYSYAEDLENEIRFVFLDTGMGIPATIRRSFFEKLPTVTTDAKLIASTLRGEFRTQTGEKYRGKGIPEIYESAKNHYINNLKLFSGRGMCSIEEDGQIIENELNMKFYGTLFSWTIKKEIDENVN